MKRRITFGWYGGKYYHLNWLLPLLPKTEYYCEPFGGSAVVLLNREPSKVETFNDLDGEIVNFFKVLRDKTEELIKAISLTPFSREEFTKAIQKPVENLSDIERARRFYVRARQVRTGLAQVATPGRWAYCRTTSNNDMAGAVSRWLGGIEGLTEIAQRLLRVQIENAPAMEVIQRYDSEHTLFYCDPPYPHSCRNAKKAYKYEMTEEEHRLLAKVLHRIKGKVAISGYSCELMNELYGDWYRIEAKPKKAHSTNSNSTRQKQTRTEVLWTNYRL